MVDLNLFEIAARYGALHDSAAGAGNFVHAHILRELARQSHRLAYTGDYLTHLVWNVDGADDEAPGIFTFSANPIWKRILGPLPVERKAHLRTAALYINARITDGAVVLVQVCTAAHTFRADARSSTGIPNVCALVGTGAWQNYNFSGLRLGPDANELLEVWVTADSTGALLDEGVYGAPNQGTPTRVNPNNLFVSGATWDANAINRAQGALVVRLMDGAGAIFASDRPFVCPGPENISIGNPALWWSADQVSAANNGDVTFRLLEVPNVRLGAFQLREEDGY